MPFTLNGNFQKKILVLKVDSKFTACLSNAYKILVIGFLPSAGDSGLTAVHRFSSIITNGCVALFISGSFHCI